MKRYPAYKDSGIEWIGEIPSDWEFKRLKYVSKINPSRPIDIPAELPCVFIPMEAMNVDGTFNNSIIKQFSELKTGFTYFAEDDVVFAKITPCFENGKGALLKNLGSKIGFGSTEFHVLRAIANRTTPEFLYYLTISGLFRSVGEAFMQGVAGQKRVTNDFVQDFVIGLPPIQEQPGITSFLDRKIAQIDGLIAKKERMIALLKEERTAVINQAVTKGLDPNVELKDSGIDWLGKIPKHWEVRKISRSFDYIGSGTTPDSSNRNYYYEGTIDWVITGDLNDGLLKESSKKITALALKDFSALKCFPKGAILIAMYGATIGKTAIADFTGCCNQACCVLNSANYFNNKFVFYWFLSNKKNIISLSTGGGQPNVSQDIIKTFKLPCPPIKEQQSVIDFLDHKTAQIDGQVERAKKSIELLKEYRIALISEVVMGKIDVSGIINE